MSQITKTQHYVPQFILKNFTEDNNNSQLNVYFRHQKRDLKLPIKKAFAENFFYDKSNKIEKGVNCLIESHTAPIIENIINDNSILLDTATKEMLLTFVCHQSSRTKRSQNSTIKQSDIIVNKVIEEIQKKEFGKIDDDISYSFTEDYKRELLNINSAFNIIASCCINDLAIHILVNNTDQGFICSDNPAVQYNWHHKDSNNPLSTSPFSSGTQYFMPISTKIYICFYDKDIYKFGKQKNNYITYLNDKQDIEWLNIMQVMSSLNCIAYKSNSKHYIESLCQKTKGAIINISSTEIGNIIRIHKNISGNLIKPNFFKIKKNARSDIVEFRNPSLVDKFDRLSKSFLKRLK